MTPSPATSSKSPKKSEVLETNKARRSTPFKSKMSLLTEDEQIIYKRKNDSFEKLMEYEGSKDKAISTEVNFLRQSLNFMNRNGKSHFSPGKRLIVDHAIMKLPNVENTVIAHILKTPEDPRDATQWHKMRKTEEKWEPSKNTLDK